MQQGCLELKVTGYHWPNCSQCNPQKQQETNKSNTDSQYDQDEDQDELIQKLKECKCCNGYFKICNGKQCQAFGTCKCFYLLKKGRPIDLTIY